MRVFRIVTGPLKVNSYFLVDEKTLRAVIIDCGENYNVIHNVIKERNLKVTDVFLTHAHFDHSGAAKKLQDDGAKIYIGVTDAPKLLDDGNLGSFFGRNFEYVKANIPLFDSDVIVTDWYKIRTFNTPGHTDGSVTFMVNDMLFTGDTLLKDCVGRTDFPTGNSFTLKKSVTRLFDLEGEYAVYPGHGEPTSLDYERKFNGFIEYAKNKS